MFGKAFTAAALALLLVTLVAARGLAARGQVQVVAHPHYRIAGHDGAATDGPYVMLWRQRQHGGAVLGTLVDERTGRRTQVRLPRGCSHPIGGQEYLGGPWLLADCTQRELELYSLHGHRWRSLAVRGPCRHRQAGYCPATAVGARWVEYDTGTPRRGDVYVFQNIASGEIRRNPQTPRVTADLNSATLAHRVCSPIRVPADGHLVFQGRFVLAVHEGNTFLGECGTRLDLPAGTSASGTVIEPGAVISPTAPRGPLHGILLPSLRRFALKLPAGAYDIIGAGLSLDHLYVEAETSHNRYDVWSAVVRGL